jgi:D-glycero-alpha-D-manno-heptose-7-phosphate kinase
VRPASASAPTRVDLAGGTLDIWPLYLLHPGALTLNVAIDRRARTRVECWAAGLRLESADTGSLHEAAGASALAGAPGAPLAAFVLQALGVEAGLSVTTESRVPPGSGLGGSSALAVTIAAAVLHARERAVVPNQLWPLVRDAEAQCIGVPTGIQDYLAALHGGVNAVHLEAGGIRVERLALDLQRIEEALLLVDAGATRFSGINNWEVFKARVDGDERVRECLERIRAVAIAMRAALLEGRFDDVAPLLAEEWQARKRLAPSISTPEIDSIVKLALEVGGAAKACGAGGGGIVAVWAPRGRRRRAVEAVRAAGFDVLDCGVDRRGLALEDPS